MIIALSLESIGPILNWMALALLFVFALAAVALLIYLASLPGRIAFRRGHRQAEAVRVCGWLGLPTGIGWVVAMVWAFLKPATRGAEQVAENQATVAQIAALQASVTELERVLGGPSS